MLAERIFGFIRRMLRDTGGASFVFVAAAIVPLVGFVGLSTDAARGYLVKARLSQALDASGLAGAQSTHDTSLLQADILKYFNANFPSDFLGSTVTGPTYTYDVANDKLVVTASAVIPTTFMRILGKNSMTVSAITEVTRKQVFMDVVLAMDVSGSMSWSAGGGQSRIEATKSAAATLINILYGPSETKDLLKMGLVPWNSKVRIWTQGTTFFSVLTTPQSVPSFINPVTGIAQTQVFFANNAAAVPLLSWPPSTWKGCVYARFLNDGITNNDGDVIEGVLNTAQGDWIGWQPVGVEGEPVSGGTCTSAGGGSECTPCPSVGITPLQASKTTILNAVNGLSAGGTTNIPQGLAWAWRVLTPDAPFTEADPSPDGERIQAIVLLTDGENYGGNGDGYKGIWGVGTPQPNMDARLLELAGNVKSSGVVIYVIQFANGGTALQDLLKQVATENKAPFYNYAPDGAALTQVFTTIANSLSELRLSK
ncbi:MAG: VWA domain-containing protein [Alphaproteobacteria bacterium]